MSYCYNFVMDEKKKNNVAIVVVRFLSCIFLVFNQKKERQKYVACYWRKKNLKVLFISYPPKYVRRIHYVLLIRVCVFNKKCEAEIVSELRKKNIQTTPIKLK